jgi:hypothetical protein
MTTLRTCLKCAATVTYRKQEESRVANIDTAKRHTE